MALNFARLVWPLAALALAGGAMLRAAPGDGGQRQDLMPGLVPPPAVSPAQPVGPVGPAAGLRYGRPVPAGVGGALNLTDQHGRPFRLSSLAGRPALVFFGFTQCGSTCPVALVTAQQVLKRQPQQGAAVVFVTLDPGADGPEQLRDFLGRVDPRIIGLTGTPEQIEAAAERYGVALRTTQQTLEHSSVWYLLDGQGVVRRVYAHDTAAAELEQDLFAVKAL
jgi:cytochrome oxidase Cu insertion factor (SCO1/SenC/PrrC family)